MTTTCITCERPVPGQEYGCPACARSAFRALTAIAGLAPVIPLTRMSTAS